MFHPKIAQTIPRDLCHDIPRNFLVEKLEVPLKVILLPFETCMQH